jgi:hypothetical protein
MARVFAWFALGAAACFGQIGVSTITGRVTDASGAVVPNAQVSVTQKGTNFTFSTQTNEEGIYRVAPVQPGDYRVVIEAQGFRRTNFEDVFVRTGDTVRVDATMQVGQVTEAVEVSGSSVLLETSTSTTGAVVSGSTLYNMPLYQRYINSTLNVVPGLQAQGYVYGGGLGGFYVAGQRPGAIGLFEDGVNGNDQGSGMGVIRPLQNAVAEVQVITTLPPAEFGHTAGGVISVAKKSGTNEIHGMASWYGRTRIMQHRLFFDRDRTTTPTPINPNGTMSFFMQPDANIAGPIVKNKTFFFFGYQRLHEKKTAQVDATTPTLEMRQGNFNFPGVTANPIFDPATTRRLPNGNWARDPFPGNMVPQARFDPVAVKLLQLDPWVAPNRPGTFNALGPDGNYLANELALVFFDDYSVRLDHQFNSSWRAYTSYTENRQSGFGRPINFRTDRLEFDHSQGRWAPFYQRNISAGGTWIVSPSIVTDFRGGYFLRRSSTDPFSEGGNWARQLGIPNLDDSLMPGFGASGQRYNAEGLYGVFGIDASRDANETLSFRSDTTVVRGRHAMKFGYEILHFRLNNAVRARATRFLFNNVTAGLQPTGVAVPNTGNTFAGFLTGYVRQATYQTDLASWLPRSFINSFYIQDDWKVTPRLTLNLGVRYSNESPFNTKFGQMSNFDPLGTDPVSGRIGRIVHPAGGLSARDNNNFNPRAGFAWQVRDRWVVRGGFGMYTIDVKFPAGRDQFDEYTAIANAEALPGDPTPVFRISQHPTPPPYTVLPDGTSPFRGTNFGARGVTWWDPALRNPYSMNFNLSVQNEFVRNYLLEVNYQGSAGVGLIERWQANTFPIDFGAGNPAFQNQVLAAAQNFRPWSAFGDVLMRSNFGHSTYHGGTVKLEKRMDRDGLMFSTFYTFAKSINSQDSDNAGSGVAPIQMRSLEKARASYDRNHRWIGTVLYELPIGKGKRWGNFSGWKNVVFGGWQLAWIQTIESGNPLNFSFANSPYNYYPAFAGARRPDLIATPVYDFGKWDNGGPDRFTLQNRPAVIDQNAAFAWPGGCGQGLVATDRANCDFRVGNAGRNIITGPRLVWAQVSAQKNFRFNERWNAQLRWDFQNALKTYNFTGPTTAVNFQNPRTFGKLTDDPRTASVGGQPLMNLTVAIFF